MAVFLQCLPGLDHPYGAAGGSCLIKRCFHCFYGIFFLHFIHRVYSLRTHDKSSLLLPDSLYQIILIADEGIIFIYVQTICAVYFSIA